MKNHHFGMVTIPLLAISLVSCFALRCVANEERPPNQYQPYPPIERVETGIAWPTGQALPTFATPAAEMDAIEVQSLTRDEQITFSSLQGQVNRRQPRLLLQDSWSDEGRDTWLETSTIKLGPLNHYDYRNKYQLLAKYASEFDGLVLYDPDRSPHYRNLASTVAGLKGLLPVTARIREHLQEEGIELKVVVDLTNLEATSSVDIYTHLYDTYWQECEKRILLSARPTDRGGDRHHTRDLAAACGAAVVWLDCRIAEQRDLMRKFLADMTPGNGVVLGWYTSERSGITTVSEFGIGTLPADHYLNATVYSGGHHRIMIPVVPPLPKLEKKTYVAIFISDGDNIQYNQRAMRNVWDQSKFYRGKVALNWTISPSLVDIGPGLLNYYYGTATSHDCFVSGPSGLGYLIPFNTLREPGAPLGECVTEPDKLDAYTRLSSTYLQRAGLRAITIWDDASPWQRTSYEHHCRQLYGATVQNFLDVPGVAGSIEGGRLRFDKLVVPYSGTYDHIQQSLDDQMQAWDGESPQFLAYQVDIWGEMKPRRILKFVNEFERRFPGKIQFVRADHYFNLYNQAHQLPFNLAMHPDTVVSTGTNNTHLTHVTDGTPTTVWTSEAGAPKSLQFDLDTTYQIKRLVVRHAAEAGLDPSLNTKAFSLKTSLDGKTWQTVAGVANNSSNVTDIEFSPTAARHVQIDVQDAGGDVVRIADVELYGSTLRSRND